jgi:hypothetical protein
LKIGKRLFGVFVCALAGLATEGCRTEAEVESLVWRIEPHAMVVQRKVLGANRTDVNVVMTDVPIDCATALGLIERYDARPPDGLRFLLTFTLYPWKPGRSAGFQSTTRYDGRGAVVNEAVSYGRDDDELVQYYVGEPDQTMSWLAVEVLDAPRIKGEIARFRVSGSGQFGPGFSVSKGDRRTPSWWEEEASFRLRFVDEDDLLPRVHYEVVGDVPTTLCTDIVVL